MRPGADQADIEPWTSTPGIANSFLAATLALRHPLTPSTNVPAERLLGVFERRQHLEPILCPARQHDLVVLELEAVVTDDHHVGAHAQETTDREHDIWLLAVTRHKEVVNLADRLVVDSFE